MRHRRPDRGGPRTVAGDGCGAEVRPVAAGAGGGEVDSRQVGALLFGPYLLGVELASMLLLAALVGAYHLGWRDREDG